MYLAEDTKIGLLVALKLLHPHLTKEEQHVKRFRQEAEWASLDPLRHLKSTGPTALGVWIGDRDRFIEGTRRFIREVRPEVGTVKAGGHDDGFYRKVTPDVVQFLAKYAKRAV